MKQMVKSEKSANSVLEKEIKKLRDSLNAGQTTMKNLIAKY